MQAKNLEYLIAAATDERQSHDFAGAVRGAVEVGVVVPSILRANLAKAGYKVVADTAKVADYGFRTTATLKRVLVTDKAGDLVAMGAAGDHDEALLHAVLGWFRENPLPGADVPAGIMEAPSSPPA